MKNKRELEKLLDQLTSSQGKKISLQGLLEQCIQFALDHIEEFVDEKYAAPCLTPEKKERILTNKIDCPIHQKEKTDDDLIYGL